MVTILQMDEVWAALIDGPREQRNLRHFWLEQWLDGGY